MNEIVVGIDRSDTARKAAESAAKLAGELGATLHVVMCVERGQTVTVSVGSERFQSDWLEEANRFVDDVARTLPHTTITRSAVVGEPAKALCDEARRLEARMIVVGNRRVQGAARVLGSIAADVAKQAPCDVLVVHTTGKN